MRTLTIKRAKKYVAWMSKSKIYIEDLISGDTVINGTLCRKIGDLKNGTEKSFVIGNEAARVFVIADKLSKNFSNEFYPIPAGEEDIYLTGQHKFNLATGNAFVFDNNFSQEVISNRKKNNKKGLIILLIAAIFGFVFGFSSVSTLLQSGDGTFTSDEMSITLTNEFIELDKEGLNSVFATEDVVVLVAKETFTDYEELESITVEEYGKLVFENSDLADCELHKENDLTYFTYVSESPDTKDVYEYKAYVFKTDKAFWMVQFATLTKDSEAYSEQIKQWASTITFHQENG